MFLSFRPKRNEVEKSLLGVRSDTSEAPDNRQPIIDNQVEAESLAHFWNSRTCYRLYFAYGYGTGSIRAKGKASICK